MCRVTTSSEAAVVTRRTEPVFLRDLAGFAKFSPSYAGSNKHLFEASGQRLIAYPKVAWIVNRKALQQSAGLIRRRPIYFVLA